MFWCPPLFAPGGDMIQAVRNGRLVVIGEPGRGVRQSAAIASSCRTSDRAEVACGNARSTALRAR